MPGSLDNEKNTAYFKSLVEASAVAEKELKRTQAKRGGQISESAVDQVLDKIFDPILDEYADLGDEILLPELTRISSRIRNIFLGVDNKSSDLSQTEIKKDQAESVDKQELLDLNNDWVKTREKFTQLKHQVENTKQKTPQLKIDVDLLKTLSEDFLKKYESVYNELIRQNDKHSLENIVFSQAKPEISNFLVEIKRWLKFLDSDKKELWMVELDELWNSINTRPNERSTGEVLKEEIEGMRKILPESLSEKERDFFNEALYIRDVVSIETKSEGATRHMCWQNAKENRVAISSFIKTEEVRDKFIESEFCGFKPKEVFNYLKDVVFSFHPEKDPTIDALAQKKYQESTSSKKPAKLRPFNYAQNGNPDPERISWTPTVQEILLTKFPVLKELPSFVLDAIFLSITVTEMRMEGFYPLYDAYIASPVTNVDAEALLPWGAVGLIDYKVGGYGGIPGYLGLFAAMTWPSYEKLSPKTKGVVKSKKPANTKSFEKGYDYNEIGARFNENDWCSFTDENSVFQKLIPFSDMSHYVDQDWWKNEGMRVLDYGSDGTRKGKAIENRAKAVIVRNYLRLMLSPAAGYDFVNINEDMKILPSPYDAFIGSFRGKEFKMSLPDLTNIYKMFDEFIKKVGDGPGKKFDSVEGIMKDLSEVVGIVAKFKQMSKVGEDDSKIKEEKAQESVFDEAIFKDFLHLTNVLLSIYIRKLYLNFIELPAGKKKDYYQHENEILVKNNILTTGLEKTKYSWSSDRSRFLSRVIDVVKAATTLPTTIQLYFTAETDAEIAARDKILGKSEFPNGVRITKESSMGILVQGERNNQRWGRFFSATNKESELHNWEMFKLFKIHFPEMITFVSKWVNPPENVKDKKE